MAGGDHGVEAGMQGHAAALAITGSVLPELARVLLRFLRANA